MSLTLESEERGWLNDVLLLLITEQALNIAESLVRQGIIAPKAAEGALHIAVATVNGVDYLLTWNCRHIANPEMQRGMLLTLNRLVCSCRLFAPRKNSLEKKMLNDEIVDEVRPFETHTQPSWL